MALTNMGRHHPNLWGPNRRKRWRENCLFLVLSWDIYFLPTEIGPLGSWALLPWASYQCYPTPLLRPWDSDWIITPAFLALQLADRLWDFSTSITMLANCYNKSTLYISFVFCFPKEPWLVQLINIISLIFRC